MNKFPYISASIDTETNIMILSYEETFNATKMNETSLVNKQLFLCQKSELQNGRGIKEKFCFKVMPSSFSEEIEINNTKA